MEKKDNNKQITLAIIGVAILIIGLVGVTYAFFNYTRTGSANTVRVGKMNFNTTSSPAINIQNVFPIDSANVNTDTDNVGSVTINVKGDTNYSNGIEYLVTVVDVVNDVGTEYRNRDIPISIDVSYTANGNGKSIGTENANYFDEGVRGGNTSYYKKLSNSTILNDNDPIVVGYIAPGETGIDGNIVIKAFLDKNKIAITNTYPESARYIYNPNITPELVSACVTYLNGIGLGSGLESGETLEAFCNGTGTYRGTTFQESLDTKFNQIAKDELTDLGVAIIEYTNDTTDEWFDDRMLLTTGDWNGLQNSGLSFKVKVEANDGIWVNDPGKIASCPNCKFMYSDNASMYTTWNLAGKTPTVVTSGLHDNYLEIVNDMGQNYFLGLVLNENNQITNAYACGLKDGTPFCVEGVVDNSKYNGNLTYLQSSELWNNTCTSRYNGSYTMTTCIPTNKKSTYVEIHDHGCARVEYQKYDYSYKYCGVDEGGIVVCG